MLQSVRTVLNPPVHDSRLPWGDAQTPMTGVPRWGPEVRLGGLRIQYVDRLGMDIHFTPTQHIFEFECTNTCSEVSLGGSQAREVTIREGSLTFGHKGILGHRTSYDENDRFSFIAIMVDPEYCSSLFADTVDGRAISFAETPGSLLTPVIHKAGKALEQCFKDPENSSQLMMEALALQMVQTGSFCWSNVAQMMSQPRVAVAKKVIQTVLDYIEAHYADDISIEKLASIAGYSMDTFIRLFKEAMGRTPYDYIMMRRIEAAKSALKRDGDSIATIAAASGFNSQSHLTNTFKRWTGVTPARYRRGRYSA